MKSHVHPSFNLADGRTAAGRVGVAPAGQAAAAGGGRGERQCRGGAGAPAGGKGWAPGAALPCGAQPSSPVVRTVDSIQTHTNNFPQFN